MKKIILPNILIIIITCLVFSCDNLTGTDPEDLILDSIDFISNDGSDGSESEVLAKSMKAYDAGGTFLGYCTSASGYTLTLYTEKGYFYNLMWGGSFTDSTLYYTDQNLAGTAYFAYLTSYELNEKTVFSVNNVLYTYIDSNSDGLADIDTSLKQYQSYYSAGTTYNYETPTDLSTIFSAFKVQTITKSTAGIPNSITTPISLVSD